MPNHVFASTSPPIDPTTNRIDQQANLAQLITRSQNLIAALSSSPSSSVSSTQEHPSPPPFNADIESSIFSFLQPLYKDYHTNSYLTINQWGRYAVAGNEGEAIRYMLTFKNTEFAKTVKRIGKGARLLFTDRNYTKSGALKLYRYNRTLAFTCMFLLH
jgi:hypothetical protein